MSHAILWQRLDQPGHDAARLTESASGFELSGCAVFADDASGPPAKPCRLDYVVTCDREWRTTSARVTGFVGDAPVAVVITVDASGRWRLNGHECPDVAGGVDVDLEFSPATNLLPIRRLRLAVGKSADVRAAWLRFPGFVLERLDQVYSRRSPTAYRYESAGGFAADLEVDEDGFVRRYADIWNTVAVW